MNVLLIGSGAREHAMAWKIKQSKLLDKFFIAPGNPGTSDLGINLDISVENIGELLAFAEKECIDLTIVGPELPLSLGLSDAFRAKGLKVFGPSTFAAQLETSKSFAKEIMQAANVPTAAYRAFDSSESALNYVKQQKPPYVVKADGLAAGKGVAVCASLEEAESFLTQVFTSLKSKQVVVEDFMEGVEASFIVATNGKQIVPLAASHDYKRLKDGDIGPNTGGMGSVSPTPNLTLSQEREVLDRIIAPVLDELKHRDQEYLGFLYAGLMISPDGEIKVVEFNVRLGDPECQVIMRRMEFDFLDALMKLVQEQDLDSSTLKWSSKSAVCLVLASAGYPESSSKGDEIVGLDLLGPLNDVEVFHAGTKNEDGKLVTNGGRVLSVTAMGDSVESARSNAYQAADLIQFRGRQLRRDIGKAS